mmetsp:Transcript_13296/g.36260  ORF Transcript_13296/g.36260 Transcript_13296/m.36260 type:complete len:398 (+) Transcript_13296:56-1249(+)
MSSLWSCVCAPKLGDDFVVSCEEAALGSPSIASKSSVLLGPGLAPESPSKADPTCSTSDSHSEGGSTRSTADTACSDLAEYPASSAVIVPKPADEFAESPLADCSMPISADSIAEVKGLDVGAPDIRAVLSSSDLAAVQALERELGVEGVEAVRSVLVEGEPLESCFLRFLRAQSFRVHQTAKALKAHLTWRASMKPADLANLTPGEICGCADELLHKYMPTWHQGVDRQGRPVVFSHYGRFRFGPVMEAGVTVEKILQVHASNSERTARLCGKQSSKLGCDISNALIIMDTEGLDPNNLRTKSAFDWARGIAKIDQEHYQDRLGQLLILNAPSSVYYFYKSVSWVLPEKARSRVRIFGGRDTWEPVLLELIEPSELPSDYGGSGPALMPTEPSPPQ